MSVPSVPHATYDQFRNAVLGRGYDVDGWWGYQCWDGVDLLYQQSDVGQYLYTARNINPSLPSGVKTCWQNVTARQRNGSGHFQAIGGAVNIRRGDILVFNSYPGEYGSTGHIAFADENYNGSDYINCLGQNQGRGANPRTGKPFNINRCYVGLAFLGIFRYKPWKNGSPTPPTPTPTQKTTKKKFPWAIAWANWDGFKH